MRNYLTLFLTVITSFCFGQVQTYYIKPIQTDSNYEALQDSSTISRNTGIQVNKLFLFIGGTNSSSSTDYVALRLFSAGLGYDFINLSYPNNIAAASLANSNDSLVFNKYRQEVCFGTPVSNDVAVDSLNSIYTRTLKLIQYLALTYPMQNWEQYLTTPTTLNWSKIIVGGHSQGSGHACYLAKHYLVDRVLMFSGPNDYSDFFSNSASWLRQAGTTPINKHFAYLSLNDEAVSFSKQFVNISGLGMLVNDDTTHVDNSSSPYGNSRCLYTTQLPGLVILNHNVPIKLSTINNSVWAYMLTSVTTTSISNDITDSELSFFPNPTSSILHIRSPQILIGKTYTLRNIMGQVIISDKISALNQFTLDISMLECGTYLISIDNYTVRFVKR